MTSYKSIENMKLTGQYIDSNAITCIFIRVCLKNETISNSNLCKITVTDFTLHIFERKSTKFPR